MHDSPDPDPAMNNTDRPYRKNNWTPYEIASMGISAIGIVVVSFYTYYAREQVKQTRAANDIAQQALFWANRPYVMWVGYVLNPISELPGQRQWRISPEVRNFGKTPAIDAIGKICDPQMTQSVTPPAFKECHISEAVDSAGIIGPDQPTNITGPAITDQDLEEIRRGQKLLYIYGDLRYRDNVTHEVWATRFCHQVKIALIQLPTREIDMRIFTVGCRDKSWNCVDKDCPPSP
jgi:hypothetical protein